MPWISDSDAPTYRFLSSGELEYRDRFGCYRICGGCNGVDFWLFRERREEAAAILKATPEGVSLEECYATHERFRWLCNWCLRASGIKPKWVGVGQIRWLLFAVKQGDQVIPAALDVLNQFPEPRHASTGTGTAITDRVAFLATLIAHCGGNAQEAYALATSQPARELMAVMSENAWNSLPDKDKLEAVLGQEAERVEAEQDGMVVPMDTIMALRKRGKGDG